LLVQRDSNSNIKKGEWTDKESSLLERAVRKVKAKNDGCIVWRKVAARVKTRSSDQCRKRWMHAHDGSRKNEPWTEEEDQKLRGIVEIYLENDEKVRIERSVWWKISKEMVGRTFKQCTERWYKSLRYSAVWYKSLRASAVKGPFTAEEDAFILREYGECL